MGNGRFLHRKIESSVILVILSKIWVINVLKIARTFAVDLIIEKDMRRLFSVFCMMLLAVSISAKTLVVYYSYTNNCHEIVTSLTSLIQADVMRIEPADKTQKYEANNYAIGTALLNAIKAAPNDAASYPAIAPVSITDLSQYENIVIVTPLWWSQMAAIMQTFLFNYGTQMTDKNVALIVSSHSSGISGVVADAERLVKNITWMGDALWINASNHSNRASLIQNWLPTLNFAEKQTTMNKIYITIDGEQTLTATLANNTSAQALMEALKQAPITYEAHDYGNFEKVGPLEQSFPENNKSITTEPGDIILYQGSNLCLYYDTNTWTFTSIGKIEGKTQAELKQILKAGQGNITVTLSLINTTGISNVRSNAENDVHYSLNGLRANSPSKGIFIRNGNKVVIK